MIFRETLLPGSFIIDVEPHDDGWGCFARTWCAEEARAHGFDASFVQSNLR